MCVEADRTWTMLTVLNGPGVLLRGTHTYRIDSAYGLPYVFSIESWFTFSPRIDDLRIFGWPLELGDARV